MGFPTVYTFYMKIPFNKEDPVLLIEKIHKDFMWATCISILCSISQDNLPSLSKQLKL